MKEDKLTLNKKWPKLQCLHSLQADCVVDVVLEFEEIWFVQTNPKLS